LGEYEGPVEQMILGGLQQAHVFAEPRYAAAEEAKPRTIAASERFPSGPDTNGLFGSSCPAA
jgi:hypothetical protein